MTVDVRRIEAGDDAALDAYLRIRAEVSPNDADSLEELRWEDATFPGEVVRYLAEAGEVPVGTGSTGRLHIYARDHPRWYVGLWVLPAWRRQGAGTSLLRSASEAARAAGKRGFQTWVSEASGDGVAYLLRHGFTVVSRDKIVGLDLRGMPPPEPALPAGFSLATLAARPELVSGVHAVALDAFPDIPTPGETIDVGTLDAFVARDVERASVPKDAFFVAVDEATGEAAGYASLKRAAGNTTKAYHDMTAVRPRYRGRGLATALKRATIAWAIDHGLEELRTGNDEGNVPMRAVNARLGYLPLPDYLGMEGPLAPPAG